DNTQFAKGAFLAAAVALPEEVLQKEDGGYVLMATLGGDVKRARVADLPGATDQPFTLMRVDDGDSLGWARWTTGTYEVILATANGQLIRFSEGDVRPSGLKAGGVAGMKLKDEADGVIGMDVISAEEARNEKNIALVWSITDNGLAKATPLSEYPKQKRHGYGVVNLKLPKESSEVVAVILGDKRTEIYVKSKRNTCKRLRLGKAIEGSRTKKPQAITGLNIGNNNRVVGVVKASKIDIEQLQQAHQLTLI
ncbi:MAG TPA: hypothetical protein ENJ56_09335, partial [Anaerolineae bacterium]|nr:hypothetical protein [Anaerolineae bacterium]